MDKLQPIIQNHFWILFGLVLILPIVGWMPATGQLSEETNKRISEIESAFNGVPKGSQANSSWGAQLKVKAELAEEKNLDARLGLWERQEAMMTWPKSIKKSLQPDTYREELSPIARSIYKNNYDVEVENVWKTVDPFNVKTGKGTVIFPLPLLPREEFGELTPSSEEIWDAQEDLWLLESLLKSIRRSNQDSTLITESLIRSVKVLNLVGGPGDYPDPPAPTGGGAGSGFPGGADGFDPAGFDPGGMEMEEMDGMGGSGMGRAAVTAGSVAFDPSDEFGDEQGRYIEYAEGNVFNRRGFYLEAIIEHQRLPELLAVLSNNSWPVTITRVQMGQASGSSIASSLLGGQNGGAFAAEMGADVEDFDAGGGGAGYAPSGPMALPGGGRLGMGPGMEMSGDPGMTNAQGEFTGLAAAAEFGPQLALVAISGVIHIYNPPENLEELLEQKQAQIASEEAATMAPAVEDLTSPAEPASPAPETDSPAASEPVTPEPAATPPVQPETDPAAAEAGLD